MNVQDQLIDQAINEKPDMILLIPLDAKGGIQQARKINAGGHPPAHVQHAALTTRR